VNVDLPLDHVAGMRAERLDQLVGEDGDTIFLARPLGRRSLDVVHRYAPNPTPAPMALCISLSNKWKEPTHDRFHDRHYPNKKTAPEQFSVG
jgi:hypothetical protein